MPTYREKCFDYDSTGRMTDMGENLPDNSANICTRFRFDTSASGMFTAPGTISNAGGRTVEAETDNCTVYPPTAATMLSDEWFSYDVKGNITDVWQKTPHSGGYYHSTATYFANGKISSLGVPAVGTINYTLDGEGKWYSAKMGTLSLVSSVTYGPTGVGTVNIGSSTDEDVYTYSPTTGLMTKSQFTVGSKSVVGTLNWNGNETLGTLQIQDGFNSANSQTCTYIYDDIARLTSDQCGPIWEQTYGYDQYDNLNQFGNDPFTFTYNASTNHYNTVGVTYDGDGNLTYDNVNSYTYNASDRLASAVPAGYTCDNNSASVCITYDAFGHAVELYAQSVYYQMVYGPAGKTLGMQGQTLQYAYVPLPGGSRALYYSGAFDYTHADWLGTGRLATSIPASGNGALYYDRSFSPYGEMYGNTGTTYSQSFTGDTQDLFVGLFDTDNRELNQSQGRWLTPDPAGQGWNRYAYVLNNPLVLVDPLGLSCENPHDGQTCVVNVSSQPPDVPLMVIAFDPSYFGTINARANQYYVDLRRLAAGNNGCTPLTKGCSDVPTAEQQCVSNFYNSTLGKAAAFGSPLALLPGWNPEWGSTTGEWAEAIVGKGGGIFGTGAAGTSGTTELTTLSGTRFVGSTLELWTGTALGAIEEVAPPAMLAATLLDIGAHARCSTLAGGALVTPSEGMYGAIP
jgi:RHS repeat-associated protein